MKLAKNLIIISIFLILVASFVLAVDNSNIVSCYDTPMCSNNNSTTFILRETEDLTFSTAINLTLAGNFTFKAVGITSANSTEVFSNSVQVLSFRKNHTIPLCSEATEYDVFCLNATGFSTFILHSSQSQEYGAVIEANKLSPVPSNWTFYSFATLDWNNTEVNSGTITVSIVSETPPVVNITVPENKTYGASFITNIQTTGSYDSCWYSLDGGTNISYTCNTGFRLNFDTEGSHTLFAYANDSKNNIASDNVTFYVEPWTAFYAAYDRLPNITFASSDWVTGSITKFNISGVPSANLIMMGSANLKSWLTVKLNQCKSLGQ